MSKKKQYKVFFFFFGGGGSPVLAPFALHVILQPIELFRDHKGIYNISAKNINRKYRKTVIF